MIAFYLRVSRSTQSTDMQLRDLQRYGESRGWTDIKIYEDLAISGIKRSRPALDQLMNDARKRKFKTIVVWRFDRFARSSQHLIVALEEFKSLGIDFISYNENIDTGSPMGQAMFTIIAALAQLERDVIRDRVISGLQAARGRGVRLGRPEAPCDHKKIWHLRSQNLSLRTIAKQLGLSKGVVQRSISRMPKDEAS